MAGGPPDLVDCSRLADEAATLDREYALSDLPRLRDALADTSGRLRARFAFGKTESGGAGATVSIRAEPMLVCQRCMEAFECPVSESTAIEFATDPAAASDDSTREPYPCTAGRASLRELAEEELLLALPVAPACSVPESCGKAPRLDGIDWAGPAEPETIRPFGVLSDLLKKP